ncbi:50S ribosome-binding GTPase [bacterium]|nr:50S ribosome-binding GTPase [bacterium]
MLDLVRLYLQAGDGGHGRVAFFRNRHVLKGGPMGGNGGNGGNIVLKCSKQVNTLQHFSGRKQYIAGDGERGGKRREFGSQGESVELVVPPGTVVWLYDENQISRARREKYGIHGLMYRDDVLREKYFVDKETNNPPVREADDVEMDKRPQFADFLHARVENPEAEFLPLQAGKLTKLVVLARDGEQVTICQGGFGGRGNESFKSSSHTTPMEAEYGTFGERKVVFLELQLLANVGLVGLPNAGKSTIITQLTGARPKIANYPFTTMEANLGVLNGPEGKSLVLADIPGLIEGASEGKGLGFDFLRHVNNCQKLVYVLALAESELFEQQLSGDALVERLAKQWQTLITEVNNYSEQIAKKSRLIVVNKCDLYSPELMGKIEQWARQTGESVIFISAATKRGLTELSQAMWL